MILSAAGILEMANSFYPLYQGFLADPRRGLAMVTDYVAEQQERTRLEATVLGKVTALVATFGDPPAFAAAAGDALEQIPVVVREVPLTPILSEALARPVTGTLDHYRFLLAATMAFYAWRRR